MVVLMMWTLAADPVPVLEHAQQLQKKAHRAQDLEIENQQLRGRLDEYNNEFAEVKNQGMVRSVLEEFRINVVSVFRVFFYAEY